MFGRYATAVGTPAVPHVALDEVYARAGVPSVAARDGNGDARSSAMLMSAMSAERTGPPLPQPVSSERASASTGL